MTDPELAGLASMPDFLAERFAGLSPAESVRRGPGGGFAPVEQCWHLADLERDGYGARIARLLHENDAILPDFDGARAARERDYLSRSVAEGIAAFRAARTANLARLRAATVEEWSRGGTLEGVGRVTLRDLPRLMAEHDAAHRGEIEAWSRATELPG